MDRRTFLKKSSIFSLGLAAGLQFPFLLRTADAKDLGMDTVIINTLHSMEDDIQYFEPQEATEDQYKVTLGDNEYPVTAQFMKENMFHLIKTADASVSIEELEHIVSAAGSFYTPLFVIPPFKDDADIVDAVRNAVLDQLVAPIGWVNKTLDKITVSCDSHPQADFYEFLLNTRDGQKNTYRNTEPHYTFNGAFGSEYIVTARIGKEDTFSAWAIPKIVPLSPISDIDVNGDNRIGVTEAIYYLQLAAELRVPRPQDPKENGVSYAIRALQISSNVR